VTGLLLTLYKSDSNLVNVSQFISITEHGSRFFDDIICTW